MTIRKNGWNERKKVIVGTKACVRLKKGVEKERRRWNMWKCVFVKTKVFVKEKVFKIKLWDKMNERRCFEIKVWNKVKERKCLLKVNEHIRNENAC